MTPVVVAAILFGGLSLGALLGTQRGVARVRAMTTTLYPTAALAPGGGLPYVLGGLEAATVSAQDEASATRDSLRVIQRAVDALPFGVVVFERDTAIDWRNAKAREQLQVGRVGTLTNAAVRRRRAAALAGQETQETIELQTPIHQVLVVSGFPIPRHDHDRGATVTIEDVTARVRLEAVRKDFVANISHELRTPVGALGLLADALEHETEPTVVKRLSGKLAAESGRLGRIVDDLLELTVLEAGAARRLVLTAADDVVAEALERSQAAADARGVRFETRDVTPGIDVLCDRRQVVSAVAHLLENAAKYSCQAGEVTVSTSQNGDDAHFTISDTGVGIPARDVDRIFERFYRVDPARSRDTGGTGLGLAIVRHVAANHFGEVTVQSTEGIGSVFTLRIPLKPPRRQPKAAQ